MIRYTIYCIIFLLLLSSCSVKQPTSETEINLTQENFENIVSVTDLNQLYLENETIFDNVISEFEKFPEDVWSISIENKKICFKNNIGEKIPSEFEFENEAVLRVFEAINNFSNKHHVKRYDVVIRKADYGWSFVIRDFVAYIDYSIEYCSTPNSTVENFNNITDLWYSYIWGLV